MSHIDAKAQTVTDCNQLNDQGARAETKGVEATPMKCVLCNRIVVTEAEFAALKATPQNTAQRINSLWTGKELLPCGCPAFEEYVYYNSETKHCHCVKCGDVYTHESQESSPSLPLEEPEQLVSQEWVERIIKECPGEWNTTKAALEIQAWRALAARRGGR